MRKDKDSAVVRESVSGLKPMLSVVKGGKEIRERKETGFSTGWLLYGAFKGGGEDVEAIEEERRQKKKNAVI